MQPISGIFFSLLLLFFQGAEPILDQHRSQILEWEDEIEQFELLDRTESYPSDSVLFVGSSSILLWDSIAEDMKPYSVIQRGYGGARLTDLAWYARRIIYPHEFSALVIFVANDISGSEGDRSPGEVLELYKYSIRVVRQKYPDVPIFWIQVTPTESRWESWPEIQTANNLIRAFCKTSENLYFIQTADVFLGSDGLPNPELFREDRLHLNRKGYELWSSIIKARLDSVLQE